MAMHPYVYPSGLAIDDDNGWSDVEQAHEITDVLWKAAESGFSGPAFIYSIRDINSEDKDDEQNDFGALLTSDWQPKVASYVLAR